MFLNKEKQSHLADLTISSEKNFTRETQSITKFDYPLKLGNLIEQKSSNFSSINHGSKAVIKRSCADPTKIEGLNVLEHVVRDKETLDMLSLMASTELQNQQIRQSSISPKAE